ncbi:hypothetical protein [Ostreiculturibacter nitratireducens]|uniref:hypothetical protein n=1 Tax=Ostreiculturibacter nitratireducens TaxID=3075226 RepID=UPI0031B5C039
MNLVRDLPCLWLAGADPNPVAAQRLQSQFPGARIAAATDPKVIKAAVEEIADDWLLIVGSDCLTYTTLALMELEPVMMKADAPFGYLSRNTVTNEIVTGHGPAIWPRARLLDTLRSAEPNFFPEPILPSVQAHWYANPDPASALRNGFETTIRRIGSDSAANISWSASLGADVRFGYFWQIGCCHALLGTTNFGDALSDVSDLLDDEGKASRAAAALARSVRLAGCYEVRSLSDAESRLVKSLRPENVPPACYESFAVYCDSLGSDAAPRTRQFREAAYWLGRSPDVAT